MDERRVARVPDRRHHLGGRRTVAIVLGAQLNEGPASNACRYRRNTTATERALVPPVGSCFSWSDLQAGEGELGVLAGAVDRAGDAPTPGGDCVTCDGEGRSGIEGAPLQAHKAVDEERNGAGSGGVFRGAKGVWRVDVEAHPRVERPPDGC